MKRPRNPWLILCIIAIAAILLSAAILLTRPRRVDVVRPHRGDAVELVYATGFVEPVQPVTVAARLTAPVNIVFVDEGDVVRKGQALLTLDDKDLRGAYAQARAQSIGATLAERRVATLFSKGWATRAARDEAVANGEAARASEKMALAKLDQNIVRAGIDGVVIKRDIEPGELAVPTRALMLLGDPRHSWVTATVDERDIPRIHIGQRALVSSDAWPGQVIHAHVAQLTPTGDPQQRAFRARLVLDNGKVLPLGMSLEVNIVTKAVKQAILLTPSAISGDTVWTVVNGRAHRQRILKGIQGQSASEITGLSPTSIVIDAPDSALREGDRVVAVEP